ncbi:MAG TPA: hypothetical protein PKZ64_04675 [Spirochaetota bacterium]|nr:hypothetical protein [Spirochaetota bacterium]HPJ41739.1 hypothetical protein [Spirochaetota bacterium]
MASSKKTIAEKNYYGLNPFFFKGTEQQGAVRKTDLLQRFETINRFYSSLEGDDTSYQMNIKDCYALKLAEAIKERILAGDVSTDKDGSIGDRFYSELALSVEADDTQKDEDLTVIYLKQMMNVMKSCGLVKIEKRKAFLPEKDLSREKLYFKILRSFWNETDWAAIFPSSPEAAVKLFSNREVFIGFLEEFYTKVSVEDLSNDFFEMTDMASANDFFMISFLDFYLLTWLRHFGIIDYITSSNSEVVHIMLNDYGREIIKILG